MFLLQFDFLLSLCFEMSVIRCKATNNTWDKIKRGTITKIMDYKWFKKKVIFFLDYWLKRGHLNRSVDIRYSIVAFNMSLLTVKLQLRLPYRKVWINWSSPWDKIWSLIFLILFKRVCLGVWKLRQWRKKCIVVSVSLSQSHNGFRVSWKHCLNLC